MPLEYSRLFLIGPFVAYMRWANSACVEDLYLLSSTDAVAERLCGRCVEQSLVQRSTMQGIWLTKHLIQHLAHTILRTGTCSSLAPSTLGLANA